MGHPEFHFWVSGREVLSTFLMKKRHLDLDLSKEFLTTQVDF